MGGGGVEREREGGGGGGWSLPQAGRLGSTSSPLEGRITRQKEEEGGVGRDNRLGWEGMGWAGKGYMGGRWEEGCLGEANTARSPTGHRFLLPPLPLPSPNPITHNYHHPSSSSFIPCHCLGNERGMCEEGRKRNKCKCTNDRGNVKGKEGMAKGKRGRERCQGKGLERM